jgi:hypothetical protein
MVISGDHPLHWQRSKDDTRNDFVDEFFDVDEFEFSYYQYTEYDPDDLYPHPYDLTQIAEEFRNQISGEAKELIETGTAMSLNNIFFVLRCCAPLDFVELGITRRLKFYASRADPKTDTMIPYRYLVGANAIASYFDFVLFREWDPNYKVGSLSIYDFLRLWYIEVFEFIFQDPMYHTKVFKDGTGLFVQSAFSDTSGGVGIEWSIDTDPRDGRNVTLTGGNFFQIDGESLDRAYLQRPAIEKGLNDCVDTLQKHSLQYTALLCKHLISADFDYSSSVLMLMLEHVRSFSGFSRTIAPLSHKRQMTISESINIPNPPYGAYLKAVWARFWDWALHSQGKFLMDEIEYLAQVPFMQTSRSAGGRKYSIPFSIEPMVQMLCLTRRLRHYISSFLLTQLLIVQT